MRLIPFLLLAAIAGCAATGQRPTAELLPGSWKQEISVYGESRQSIIKFNSDGTFTEETGRQTRIGFESFPPLYGKWHLQNEVLTLEYTNGFSGKGKPETDKRRVLRITDTKFVSSDTQFGVIVERERYADTVQK